jgi:non-reducing end alpha-L-arabinofuranosidase
MAPITIGGHKAYGVFIMPGMGLRNNDAVDLAIGDEAEGIYYVVDGKHYDSGCCFDYGNASTNGRAVGTGTMETTYFGTSTAWGSGAGPGPWIMSDMEAGLFSGYNAKQNAGDPTIDSWRFVTAVVDGGGGNKWDLRGGNAQNGGLTTFYSGVRPGSQTNNSYYPMHKQGAILLGTGGDNGNGSSGTFYEGVMTAGYPSEATTDAVQANIVAAHYDVQRLGLSRITTFTPGSSQDVTATFTNTTGAAMAGLRLSVAAPAGWSVGASKTVGTVAPGASVSAAFKVTSAATTGSGFVTGKAEWTGARTETTAQRVRNVLPVKINEVDVTNQFVELYNASAREVDLSGWSLIHTASQWAAIKLATIPSGTKLKSGGFYLLGLSGSGLAAPASAGATVIHVRNAAGFAAGQKTDVDGEMRTIVSAGSAATAMTTVFLPVSTGRIAIPVGATNVPITNAAGFAVGEMINIDLGGNYEWAIVTAVGKAATQTTLAAAVAAGATGIKVVADSNMTVGDTLTIGTGRRKEVVKVASVGTAGVSLATPLKFDHAAGIDVSDPGTGVRFSPATKFAHVSGDAVQALGSGVTLDKPLARGHAYGAPVSNSSAGYQGPPAPNQWFGAVLSTRAGSIALIDAGGTVVDAIVYGSQQSNSSANGTIASPELATLEGDQGKGGCIAVLLAGTANRSLGRFPDGADTDSNCADFLTQSATTLAVATAEGATNLKVASVAGFEAGQTVLVDTGANLETAVIGTVGTAGATTVRTAIEAGATVIPVASGFGFSAGQTITVEGETAVVVSSGGGRRGAGGTITVAAPLRSAHAVGAQVAGSGITFTAALKRAHAAGSQIAAHLPTPGAPNQLRRR